MTAMKTNEKNPPEEPPNNIKMIKLEIRGRWNEAHQYKRAERSNGNEQIENEREREKKNHRIRIKFVLHFSPYTY